MKKIFLSIMTLLFFASCSKYQKILKSTDLNLKFEKAVMYYEKEDFNRALPLFEELSTAFRGSAKAEEVNYYYAEKQTFFLHEAELHLKYKHENQNHTQ